MTKSTSRRITNQVFGLALLTATGLLMLAVSVLLIDETDVVTPAVLSIALAVSTYVVWRFDTVWATTLGLVAALAATSTVFYLAFGIFQPFSPIEFVAGLLLVIGFLFALIGGIGSLIRHRRSSAAGGERLRLGALLLIGVATLVSVAGFFTTRTTVDSARAADAALVDMENFVFAPEKVTIDAGQQLLLTNSDAFAHDFTLERFDLYTYLGPGSEALVDVSSLPPGTYPFSCSLHAFDGEGMIGTLTVEG